MNPLKRYMINHLDKNNLNFISIFLAKDLKNSELNFLLRYLSLTFIIIKIKWYLKFIVIQLNLIIIVKLLHLSILLFKKESNQQELFLS